MKRKTLLALCAFLFVQSLLAQGSFGTEFWLGYMENLNLAFNDPPVFTLYVDAEQSTNVTVEVPQTGLVLNFTAAAATTTAYTLPNAIWYTEDSEVIDNKGIKVTSNEPIQLYAFHYRAYFSESTLVLPVTELDTDYWLHCFYDDYESNSPSSFVIVSTADDNEIEITPSSFTLGLHPAGVPFTITLNEGQNYPVQAIGDLTGSRVRSLSGEPIAVFSGAQEAIVELCGANSHLYDQAIPNSLWGTEYYFVPLSGQGGDVVKILAQEDGTEVYFNCVLETTLQAGEFYRVKLTVPTVINALQPIAVAQFNSSQECNPSGIGDPNMLQLVSTDHQGFSSRFVSPLEFNGLGNPYFSAHFANVVTATADVGVMFLDGGFIGSAFQPFPGNVDLSYAQLELEPGQHQLSSPAPFYAYAYGFGDYDAYTHNLGYFTEVPVDLLCLELQIDGLYCVDSVLQFSALSNQAIVDYNWDLGNNQTSTQSMPTTSYTAPGIYTIVLEVTATDGSTLTETISLQIFDCPTDPCINPVPLEIVADGVPCEGPLQFSYLSDSTFNTLTWDLGNGLLSNAQSPSFEYLTQGLYTITLLAYDSYNCVYQASFELEVPDCSDPCIGSGDVEILVDGSFCVDSVLTFSTTVDFDQIGPAFIDWVFSNGQNYFDPEVTLSFSDPGVYQVDFSAFDIFNGCEYFGTLQFTIDDDCLADPCDMLPELVLSTEGAFCTDSLITFSYSTMADLVSYEWDFGAGYILFDPEISVAFPAAGVYAFFLTAFDANGCEYNESFFFDIEDCAVDPCIDLQAVSITTTGGWCAGAVLTFQAETTANLVGYLWDFEGYGPLTDPMPELTFPEAGVYDVLLTAFDNNGCEYFAALELEVENCTDPCDELPPLSILAESSYCVGETVQFSYETDADLVVLNWAALAETGNGATFELSLPEEAVFVEIVLEGEDALGCLYTTAVLIEVVDCIPAEDCEIYFPNAFSPNSDGTNDGFRALYNCTPETYYLAVYSRWGGLIFETTNPETAWDGTFEGAKMPVDVYALLARYRLPGATEETLESGDLMLLR